MTKGNQHPIEQWLSGLDALPLECDGMTRTISTLLERDGIPHTAYCGRLRDSSNPAKAVIHWWIELDDGHILDFRARMWMGNDAPHGAFIPDPASRYEYVKVDQLYGITLPLSVLSVMTGTDLSAYPHLHQT